MSLYKRVKSMPNPSEGLFKGLRKGHSIWAYASDGWLTRSTFVSLKKTKEMSLRDLVLIVGSPSSFGHTGKFKDGGKSINTRSYSGIKLKPYMFHGRNQGAHTMVGIGTKKQGKWFIDVTDRVVKELNTYGSCILSEAHCRFDLISPRVKQCRFCKRKLYKKVEVQKNIYWRKK